MKEHYLITMSRKRRRENRSNRGNLYLELAIMIGIFSECFQREEKEDRLNWKLGETKVWEERNLSNQHRMRIETDSWNDATWLEGQYSGRTLAPSNKERNRQIKSVNGNGNGMRNMVKIYHWNLGARFWQRKREEIEVLLEEKDPDLLIISEANIMKETTDEQRQIAGYSLVLPNTMDQLGYARVALLIKEDIIFKTLNQFMIPGTSSIWVSMGVRGRKPLVVGGLYREHTLLRQGVLDTSNSPHLQLARWNAQLEGWKAAAEGNPNCVAIGDMNLDFMNWNLPNQNIRMIERTKTEIETIGFLQLVSNVTRSWPGQADTCVDHIWTNSIDRIIAHANTVRANSDHNMISVFVRMKDKIQQRQEMIVRNRKKMDKQRIKDKVRQIDWEPLYGTNDINIMNDFMETKLSDIYNSEAPLTKIQVRRNYRTWVGEELKGQMRERDQQREIARRSGDREEWQRYKRMRNNVTKMTKNCKNDHFSKLYSKLAAEKNTKEIYGTTKELLGWQRDMGPRCFFWGGQMVRKPVLLANIQIDYFCDKIKRLSNLIRSQKQEYMNTVADDSSHGMDDIISQENDDVISQRSDDVTRQGDDVIGQESDDVTSQRSDDVTSNPINDTIRDDRIRNSPDNSEISSQGDNLNTGINNSHDISQRDNQTQRINRGRRDELNRDRQINDPIRRLVNALNRWTGRGQVSEFHFRKVTVEETVKLILRLGNPSSCGLDGLDSNFLKLVTPSIAAPLAHIINTSLTQSTWANKWKIGKIFPLLKDKSLDKFSPASFRPVCILPTLSKIVERAAQLQMQDFFEKSGQLNQSAHAYRMAHSTTTTIASIMDEVYQAAEDKKIAQLMTLDQSAAFDCVSHEILIRKLKEYKVSGQVVKWIQSYLSFRSQFVTVGTVNSHMRMQERGVPQGSVIGPLLYAIFVNDITETTRDENCRNTVHEDNSKLFGETCLDCGTINTYADDSTFTVASKKRQRNLERMTETFGNIKKYLLENELHLNAGKTTVLECMLPQKKGKMTGIPPQLKVTTDTGEEKTIVDTGMCRILGSNIQGNMTWLGHLETGDKALLPGIRRKLGALKQLGCKIPRSCKKTLAEGVIVSRLLYLLPIWGSTTRNQWRKGQILLNKAARWVTGLRKTTRIGTLMREVGWLDLREMYLQHSCMLLWRIIHLKSPGHLWRRLEIDEEWKVKVEDTRIQFTERGFRWNTCRIWNTLPSRMRSETSIACFKKQLKTWILDRRLEEQREPD